MSLMTPKQKEEQKKATALAKLANEVQEVYRLATIVGPKWAVEERTVPPQLHRTVFFHGVIIHLTAHRSTEPSGRILIKASGLALVTDGDFLRFANDLRLSEVG